MAATQPDLEWIVREVVRRLSEQDAAVSPAVAESASSEAVAAAENEVWLEQQVVTLATLDGTLGTARRVVVTADAVVTPSVRDLLRAKGVELCFGRRASGPAPQPDVLPLLVGIAAVRAPTAALEKMFVEEHRGAELLVDDCLIHATQKVAQAAAAGTRLGMIVTERPAIAVCLANRRAGVRAVWGVSVALVAAAAKTAGTNLLVVHPTEHSLHELRSITREFVQGSHVCPETWNAALA
jgi:hypothetical protein